MYRYVILFRYNFKTACVVGMLVSYEDCINVFERRAKGGKRFFNRACTLARVNENLVAPVFYVNAIPRRAGK